MKTLTRRGLLLRSLAATGAVALLVAVRAAPLAFAAQPGDADHTRIKRPRLLTEPPTPRRDRRDRRDRGGLGAPPVGLTPAEQAGALLLKGLLGALTRNWSNGPFDAVMTLIAGSQGSGNNAEIAAQL